MKFPLLRNLQPPMILDREDDFLWLTNDGKKVSYTSKQPWAYLRNNMHVVPRHRVIWFPQANPKHAFIMWLALKNRLTTQDRLQVWYPNQTYKCLLCSGCRDSIDHLFFQSGYALNVWRKLKLMLLYRGLPNKFHEVVSRLMIFPSSKKIWNVVNRLIVAVLVYFVWQERNLRLFKNRKRNEEDICKMVVDYMKLNMKLNCDLSSLITVSLAMLG
ncbi:uncharacterized protein [Rutidosis leptorrhynchoides]|uniref:uncharacterized protein n=1 Tax=Rutidosis leptorrhynchoides TaxID=125765 RepID=UPI003A99E865